VLQAFACPRMARVDRVRQQSGICERARHNLGPPSTTSVWPVITRRLHLTGRHRIDPDCGFHKTGSVFFIVTGW